MIDDAYNISDDVDREWETDDDESTLTPDGEPRYRRVNCCRCGKPTTFDPIYEDLCGSCCRAANE